MTWGWRKILQLRLIIHAFIWFRIGDGMNASAWYDQWSHVGPLSSIVTTRDMFRAGFNLETKVEELICNGRWTWPSEWNTKYALLDSINPPNLSDTSDRLEWRDVSGNVKPFGVATVWDSLRYRHDVIPWFHVVWFSHCVPRFSFHLWLVLHGKLKTQDSLRQWDVHGDLAMICPLCEGQPDSHAHVFFECLYSMQVWDNLKGLAGLSHVAGRYMDIVEYLIPFAKRHSCKSVIAKLVLSASAYYLWQERNARLFSNQKRAVAEIMDVIKTSVRLKLLSCSFKKSKVGMEFVLLWRLPEATIIKSS
ncbi:hypothetical protein Tco_0475557 [Tanacetum coccineum]